MEKAKRIYLLSFLVLTGFSASLIYHYIQGVYLNNPYPLNTFLFLPKYSFKDFYTVYSESINLNPYLGEKSGQYPFMILLGRIFALITKYESAPLFLMICSIAFIFIASKYLKTGPWYLQASSILAICILSYPFLFTIDRGNFELLLFLFLLIFIFLFEKKRYFLSTIPLALAIAMKVYPAILLVLFIPERKWKELVYSVGGAVILTLGSLFSFQGGFIQNVDYLLYLSNFSNNDLFRQFISIEPGSVIQRGVTIVSLFKVILGNRSVVPSQFWVQNFEKIYMIIAAFVGILIILYVILKQIILWKKVAILVFLMLLLPPISGDYKLIHLFLPLFLFCNNDQFSKLDVLYVLLFAILLIPKDYYIYPKLISDASINNTYFHDVSIAMPINIIVLMIFTVILMVSNRFDLSGSAKVTAI